MTDKYRQENLPSYETTQNSTYSHEPPTGFLSKYSIGVPEPPPSYGQVNSSMYAQAQSNNMSMSTEMRNPSDVNIGPGIPPNIPQPQQYSPMTSSGLWSNPNSGYPNEAFNNGFEYDNTNPNHYYAKNSSTSRYPMPLQPNDVLECTEITIRQGFVRKVFSILLTQLLVTFAIIALFIYELNIKSWVKKNPLFMIILAVVIIILTIVIYAWDYIRKKSPLNLIALGILTILYALLTASITAYFSVEPVLYAIVITATICLGLFLFSLQTKFKFTRCSGFLVVLLILIIIGVVFGILVNRGIIDKKQINSMIFACIGALILSFFLIFDLKRIVNGKHKFKVSPEEYITAALGIYVDLLIMFIIILVLLVIMSQSDGECSGGGGGGGGHVNGGGIWLCCWGDVDRHRTRQEIEEERRNQGWV